MSNSLQGTHMACATSKRSDQSARMRRLIRAFDVRIYVVILINAMGEGVGVVSHFQSYKGTPEKQ